MASNSIKHKVLVHDKDKPALFVLLFTIVLALVMYTVLPEQVVSHWTADGIPAGVSAKEVVVLGFPVLMFILFVTLSMLPYIEQLKPEFELIHHEYSKFKTAVMLFLLYVFGAICVTNLDLIPFTVTLPKLLIPGISLLVYYLGIVLPRMKPNLFFGVRTPWTMKHDKVWEVTHKKAGKLFRGASVVIMFSIFLKTVYSIGLTIAAIILPTIYLVWYSYSQHTKQPKQKEIVVKKVAKKSSKKKRK